MKHYATTEFVVGGVIGTVDRPQELILGRYDSTTGELRVAGRTTPLTAPAAAELARTLTPAGEEHPWPAELPPSWRHPTREPTAYTRVVPELVVEARVDAATLGGEPWRHGSRNLRMPPTSASTTSHGTSSSSCDRSCADALLPISPPGSPRRRPARHRPTGTRSVPRPTRPRRTR